MVRLNFDDVLGQLQSAGLIVDAGTIVIGQRKRCLVENGGKEKRGWYQLYEIPYNNSVDTLIVGSFGIFWGAENIAYKVTVKRDAQVQLTLEQREAIKKRIAEDRKRAEIEAGNRARRAAEIADHAWRKCSGDGHCEYLDRKQIKAFGVRFSPAGNMAIPMLDAHGKISGLQIIYADKKKKGRDKDFWPAGVAKKGKYFLIGGIPDGGVVLVCEGYATGAALHEATGLPVVVAFDAGNLMPAAESAKKRFKRVKFLFCADDDYSTVGNPGVASAKAAALGLGGEVIVPVFSAARPDDKSGPTDFNDLHTLEGLHVVTVQVEARLRDLNWTHNSRARKPSNAGAGREDLSSLLSVPEACDRYSLIYGAGATLFDHQEHILVPKSDVMDILVDNGWREWKLRVDRKVVRLDEVGFDPAGKDKNIKCNLWGGWPTRPKKGKCNLILELLEYLCAEEEKPQEVFKWVLCWLAYPIQNPGAKMRTALIMHGPQGVGKNMFFETYMAIFGEYGRIIDQATLEDKFNDWVSKKLFLIADEVVARAELYHVKNKLKHLITGDWIRVNPKNVSAHNEKNHVNLVFLSNEIQPLVIDPDDRRYAVIWTPMRLSWEYYEEVEEEISGGAAAALHHYLLNFNVGNFKHYTLPPDTKSKRDLVQQSLDSTERFWLQYLDGEIDGIPALPVRTEDIYELYRAWCARTGISRSAPLHTFISRLSKRPDCERKRERCYVGSTLKQPWFLIPGSVKIPAGKTREAWITESMVDFSTALKNWKEAKRDGF